MKDKKWTIEEVRNKLFTREIDWTDEYQLKTFIEQYKMFIDNTLKMTERLEGINNFFIASNSLTFSILGFFIKDLSLSRSISGAFLISFLLLLGFLLSFSWIRVMDNYKKTSAINYLITQILEEKLPIQIFTFKFFAESEGEKKRRANTVVYIISIIPKLFIVAYLACIFMALPSITP